MKNISFFAGCISLPNDGVRITCRQDIEKCFNHPYTRDRVGLIRWFTRPGTDKVLTDEEQARVSHIKRGLVFACLMGYSRETTLDWQLQNYAPCGRLCADIDKGLPPGTTAGDITREYERNLLAAGKNPEGRILMIIKSPSGRGFRYTLQIPFEESSKDLHTDWEREKAYFGRFTQHLDKGCTQVAVRPQFLAGDLLFCDEESLFSLSDEWYDYCEAELAKPNRKQTPTVKPLVYHADAADSAPTDPDDIIERHLMWHHTLRRGLTTEGERNSSLLKLARGVARSFSTVEELMEALANYSPLRDGEFERTVRQGWKYGREEK